MEFLLKGVHHSTATIHRPTAQFLSKPLCTLEGQNLCRHNLLVPRNLSLTTSKQAHLLLGGSFMDLYFLSGGWGGRGILQPERKIHKCYGWKAILTMIPMEGGTNKVCRCGWEKFSQVRATVV